MRPSHTRRNSGTRGLHRPANRADGVKFKIDENLPAEAAEILNSAGFDAHTIADESLTSAKDETVAGISRSEDRILVTLDPDFANIRAYPRANMPESSCFG
jgi:predicted nuclease of predicted toxin-antitoxin system